LIAEDGLAQEWKFIRKPWDLFFNPTAISAEDVRFAKAMIVHHQAAVDMATDYMNNPDTSNTYLELMNVDIVKSQQNEIDFMNKIIASYPGNPDDVVITPDMIHGMEHMGGGHHNHHM
jgi:uncharacterized protein (DUF305 family)